MKTKNLLLVLLCVSSFGAVQAKPKSSHHAMCSEKSCGIDKSCQCYCSVKCGPREQDEEDSPIFAKIDNDGKAVPAQCYCKTNDLDEYNRQCSPSASKRIMNRRQARRSKRRTTVQSN
ncbi:MAG: hypothetical protein P4L31_04345 [Candidatus Babeliales bacterium]|nr:hypothetical protein [Candidatus Babeliales bacterium]